MISARIHLNIDRVVLRGIPHEQCDALISGLHAELSRLLAAPDFASGLQGHHFASVSGGKLRNATDAAPGELGKQAAQRLAQSIRG